MTSSQIAEWIAYAELEPFGSGHESNLWGMLCATVANFSATIVKEGGKRKVYGPTDFIPDFTDIKPAPEKKKQTPEEMKAIFMGIAAGVKNKLKGKKR